MIGYPAYISREWSGNLTIFVEIDGFKESGSVSRAPLLHGSNYAYWKAITSAFIKSIDHKTWKTVVNGLSPPTKRLEDKVNYATKTEKDCDPTEDLAALANSNACYLPQS